MKKSVNKELVYFDIEEDLINKYPECKYYVVYGERSNGKTFSSLCLAIKEFIHNHSQSAYVRRFEDDIKTNKIKDLFKAIVEKGKVHELTNGKYNSVVCREKKLYLAYKNGDKVEVASDPFLIPFAISLEEHYKSLSYPLINTIILDEFITRNYELPDEFVKFTSILSTIIRERDNVKIIMLANSISMYKTTYFRSMGLNRVKDQKKNTIDTYQTKTEDGRNLYIACMYVDFVDKKGKRQVKPSDVYFAFDNPKMKMITSGEWEYSFYPLLPYKYEYKEIIYRYYIKYEDDILQCEIIKHKNEKSGEYEVFTYIHRKTTEIKEFPNELIFSTEYNPSNRYRRKINRPLTKGEERLYRFFKADKVFYQNNIIGEIVRAYLNFCYQN